MSFKPLEITEYCSRLQIFSRKSLEISNFCLKNCSKFGTKTARKHQYFFENCSKFCSKMAQKCQLFLENCFKLPNFAHKLFEIFTLQLLKNTIFPRKLWFLFLGLEHMHIACDFYWGPNDSLAPNISVVGPWHGAKRYSSPIVQGGNCSAPLVGAERRNFSRKLCQNCLTMHFPAENIVTALV